MSHVVLSTLLVAVLHFVFTATGGVVWLAPALGGLAVFFWRLVDPDERGRHGLVRVVGAVAGGTMLGALAALLAGIPQSAGPVLIAATLAIGTAAVFYQLGARRRSAICVLCKRPADEASGFDCPRCADRVCARPTCWNARYSRCVRCHEREIVVFPIAEKWWVARLGPRVRDGECTSCGKEARETDLRECGQCHWPMCRRCWDHYNGACRRCEWVIPDVPARLRPFVRARRGRDERGQSVSTGQADESMRPRRS